MFPWGTLIILALLPTYLVRTSLGPVPTTLLELAIWGVAVGTFGILLRREQLLSTVRSLIHTLRTNRLLIPMILFIVAVTIGALTSEHPRTSWGAWKAWLIDPLIIFALILGTLRGERDVRWGTLALVAMSSVLSLYGLWEYFFAYANLEDGRLDSVFVPANYHAMLTVPILALSLGLVLAPGTPRAWRIILSLLGLPPLAALVFTFSYGGFLALAGAVLFLLLVQPGKIRRLGLAVVAVAMLALIISQVSDPKFARLFDLEGRSSAHVRAQVWQTTVLMIKERPLSGIGFGDYEYHYRRLVPQVAFPPLEWLVAQPHNLYLALWAEAGILGLLSFLWLVVQFFRLGFRHRSSYSLAFMAAMVAILLHGLVDTPYFKNDLAVLFWVLVALLIVLGKSSPRTTPVA